MTHTEREWRDGQPEGTGLDESTGLDENTAPDPPVPPADPLAEQAHEDPPLVERVGDDGPLVERVHEDGPLVERASEDRPLVEEVHEPAGLGSAGDHERFVGRWQEIQAGFVDEPRRAVQDADALVVDMMDRLARMLASEREQLESAGETGKISTEDLRQGLRRYRTLFERLLAV
ncbi:MAG TPA: hypothetical protein VNO54_27130 [Streptosporangiaceae bacterium]|nr:hypothetical protein [Streptosporangiaceae bacterium]